MDVRSQVSMVFHLDKCIGCHTCSIACKNIWTDREGAEYMWWNNVETKPGTGYPTAWEDQEKYRGGWEWTNREAGKGKGDLELRATSKSRVVRDIFHNPAMPSLDDYYEPWTYEYSDLFNAPEGPDQPTARAVSKITGLPIEVDSGPNWDDDLSGSEIYAKQDPNLKALSYEQKEQLFAVERLVMFYFPRICNHCLNPSCVASCPSGALYKRGEDGIVLVNQEQCRAWRMCVSACPYKKVYFNWSTGKSEKCILCFPRVETGQAPACFHSCVGRIRYLGILLYDADKLPDAAKCPDHELVEAQRDLILDPNDPAVIAGARKNGISDDVIESAQKSPIYKFVKVWKIALPPHIEHRTFPMLFYVPPLSPVISHQDENGIVGVGHEGLFHDLEKARVPVAYLAELLGAGNEGKVRYALRKQLAVRAYRRQVTVGDISESTVDQMLQEANTTREEAEAIYQLTSLCTFDDRFVIPPAHREEAIEALEDPVERKEMAGFGFLSGPKRGI
jgi:nitrate reductase beta subunit